MLFSKKSFILVIALIFTTSFLALVLLVQAQAPRYHLPNPLYLTLRNVTSNQEYGNTGQGVRAALPASSTDTLLFKWAKVEGAEAYWYSSDLTEDPRNRGTYLWNKLDTPKVQDRGTYYTLEMPVSTIPEGTHWFQITACSKNAQDCSQSNNGYPYLYVWVRVGMDENFGKLSATESISSDIPSVDFTTISFNNLRSRFALQGGIIEDALFRQARHIEAAHFQLFSISASSTDDVRLDYLKLKLEAAGGEIDARDVDWKLFTWPDPLEEIAARPSLVTSNTIVFEDINYRVPQVPVDEEHFGIWISPVIDSPTPPSWRNKFLRITVLDSKMIGFNQQVNLRGANFPISSRYVLFAGFNQWTFNFGDWSPEKNIPAIVRNFSLLDYPSEILLNTILGGISPTSSLRREGNAWVRLLTVATMNFFELSDISPELILNKFIRYTGPNFDIIATGAFKGGMPLKTIVRTYERMGYLRQAVRSVLRAGADTIMILRALKESDVPIDSVRQLYNEFPVSPGRYVNLISQAGYPARSLTEQSLAPPQGIRIGSLQSNIVRTFHKVVLKGVYVAPNNVEPTTDWQEQMNGILEQVSNFYERELRGAVTTDYLVYPRAVRSSDCFYTDNVGEIFNRIFSRNSPDYEADFARQESNALDISIVFIKDDFPGCRIRERGIIGAAGNFSGQENQLRGEATIWWNLSNLNGTEFTIAHEVGHALSFPHSWNVIENPDEVDREPERHGLFGAGHFQNIPGNVMGYNAQYVRTLIKEGFITDNLINLILVGERSPLSFDRHPPQQFDIQAFAGNINSINEIRAYVSTMRSIGGGDALIAERLLADGVSPELIIRSYQGIEGGLYQLIRALRDDGKVSTIEIIRALKSAGFTRDQVRLLRPAFGDLGAFLQAYDMVFPPGID